MRIREGGPGIVVQHLERIAAGGASAHKPPLASHPSSQEVERGDGVSVGAARLSSQGSRSGGFFKKARDFSSTSRHALHFSPCPPLLRRGWAQAPVPPAPFIMTMLNTAFYTAGPCASGSFANAAPGLLPMSDPTPDGERNSRNGGVKDRRLMG